MFLLVLLWQAAVIQAKEPYVFTKEPYVFSKKPYVFTKEPYVPRDDYRKRNVHLTRHIRKRAA